MFSKRMLAVALLGLGVTGTVRAQEAEKPVYLNPNVPAECVQGTWWIA